MSATSGILLDDVTLGYARHPAVHHLSGAIGSGSLTAVVGPNGAGKSTLLKGLVGMLKPLSGSIGLGKLSRRDIAYLPQAAEIDRSFPMAVYDLVAMGLWKRHGLFGGMGRGDSQRIGDALGAVGLTGFENRPIGTLSGGQTQRALFARLLLQDAPVILLDEPFNALDTRTVSDLLDIIRRWHGEQRTVIAVLHDMDLVRAHFTDALLLARSPVAWGPAHEVLTAENLFKARHMIEAFDPEAAICSRDAA
jgi:zinc/manganese transport system ATP-binding protein